MGHRLSALRVISSLVHLLIGQTNLAIFAVQSRPANHVPRCINPIDSTMHDVIIKGVNRPDILKDG